MLILAISLGGAREVPTACPVMLSVTKALVGIGRLFLSCTSGLRKQSSHFVGLPFSSIE